MPTAPRHNDPNFLDRKVLGTVHEATKIVLAAVVLSHVVISALSNLPAFAAYAQAVAAG